MDAISQTTHSNEFSLMKMYEVKISLKFVPNGPINNIPALVQMMAWHRLGDKPLSESMMVNLLTHICIIRSQWVKKSLAGQFKGKIADDIFKCISFNGNV